jgi:hypothetical protein
MDFSHIQHCTEITADLIKSVSGSKLELDLLKLLERVADISAPNEKAPIVLLLLARVAVSAPWLKSPLKVTLTSKGAAVQLGFLEVPVDGRKNLRIGHTYVLKAPVAEFRPVITKLQVKPELSLEKTEESLPNSTECLITLILCRAPKTRQSLRPPGKPKNPSLRPPKNPSLRPKDPGKHVSLKPKQPASPEQEPKISHMRQPAAPRIDLFASDPPPNSDTSDIDNKW